MDNNEARSTTIKYYITLLLLQGDDLINGMNTGRKVRSQGQRYKGANLAVVGILSHKESNAEKLRGVAQGPTNTTYIYSFVHHFPAVSKVHCSILFRRRREQQQ